MAAVLQHQIEGRVNDLYFKMASHAKIIMTLSVELDRMKADNEDMKGVIRQNRATIKKLLQERERSANREREEDVLTSDSQKTSKDFFNVNSSDVGERNTDED